MRHNKVSGFRGTVMADGGEDQTHYESAMTFPAGAYRLATRYLQREETYSDISGGYTAILRDLFTVVGFCPKVTMRIRGGC